MALVDSRPIEVHGTKVAPDDFNRLFYNDTSNEIRYWDRRIKENGQPMQATKLDPDNEIGPRKSRHTDPHVKVAGKPDNIKDAKTRVLSFLDTRTSRLSLKLDVSHTDHSHVIGRLGAIIQSIMSETGTHIHFPDCNRGAQPGQEKSNQVSIAGQLPGIEVARMRIREHLPLVFKFDLRLSLPDMSGIKESLQQRYGVAIMTKPNDKTRGSSMTSIQVRGNVKDAPKVMEATRLLMEHLTGQTGNTFAVKLEIAVSQQYHIIVMGEGGEHVKRIMKETNTNIRFPDPVPGKVAAPNKGTIKIEGAMEDVFNARQQLVGRLPVILVFDTKDEKRLSEDLGAKLSAELDIAVKIKDKQRNSNGQSVTIRTVEMNSRNLYVARRKLLGLTSEEAGIAALNRLVVRDKNNNMSSSPPVSLPPVSPFLGQKIVMNPVPVPQGSHSKRPTPAPLQNITATATVTGATGQPANHSPSPASPHLLIQPSNAQILSPILLVPGTAPGLIHHQMPTAAAAVSSSSPNRPATVLSISPDQRYIISPSPTGAPAAAYITTPAGYAAAVASSGGPAVITSVPHAVAAPAAASHGHDQYLVAAAQAAQVYAAQSHAAAHQARLRSLQNTQAAAALDPLGVAGPAQALQTQIHLAQLAQLKMEQEQLLSTNGAVPTSAASAGGQRVASPHEQHVLAGAGAGGVAGIVEHGQQLLHYHQPINSSGHNISTLPISIATNVPTNHSTATVVASSSSAASSLSAADHNNLLQQHHLSHQLLQLQLNQGHSQSQFQSPCRQSASPPQNHQVQLHHQLQHMRSPLSTDITGHMTHQQQSIGGRTTTENIIEMSQSSAATLSPSPPTVNIVTSSPRPLRQQNIISAAQDQTSADVAKQQQQELCLQQHQQHPTSLSYSSIAARNTTLASIPPPPGLSLSVNTATPAVSGVSGNGTSASSMASSISPKIESLLNNEESQQQEPNEMARDIEKSLLSLSNSESKLKQELAAARSQGQGIPLSRAPGAERRNSKGNLGSSPPFAFEYEHLKLQATKALQKKPLGESRHPTDYWSGLGFSKSMPDSAEECERLQQLAHAGRNNPLVLQTVNELGDDLDLGRVINDRQLQNLLNCFNTLPSTTRSSHILPDTQEPGMDSSPASVTSRHGGNATTDGHHKPIYHMESHGPGQPQMMHQSEIVTSSPMAPGCGSSSGHVAAAAAAAAAASYSQTPTREFNFKDVPELLSSLGLSQWIDQFQSQEIDLPVFFQMTENDLRDTIGINTFGARKKIISVIEDYRKQQVRAGNTGSSVIGGSFCYPIRPDATCRW